MWASLVSVAYTRGVYSVACCGVVTTAGYGGESVLVAYDAVSTRK